MNWWLVAAFWLLLGTVVGIIVGSWLAAREDDLDDPELLAAWEGEWTVDPFWDAMNASRKAHGQPEFFGPYDHETGLDFDRNERIRRENR